MTRILRRSQRYLEIRPRPRESAYTACYYNAIKRRYYTTRMTAFLLAASSRIEISRDDEPAVSGIIVLGFLRPSRGEVCALKVVCERHHPRGPGGRRDASEATPVNVEARGQSRRCLLRFLLLTFGPAGVYLLFSRRFLRLDSSSLFLFLPLSIALSMSLGDISFPFRSAGLPYPSRASSSSLCLDRRRSHQRSPLSRGLLGDPTVSPVRGSSRQP